MTIINGLGATRAPAGRRLSRVGASSFTLSEAPSASLGPEGAAGAAPALPLGGLLAIQEDDSERRRNRIARGHGEAILEELTRLQAALLRSTERDNGGCDKATLSRLADLAARVPETNDPMLADALEAVTLRARIEIARRDRKYDGNCVVRLLNSPPIS